MANGGVSNKDLYDSLDRVRLELKTDIIRLEAKFDNLEGVRLTRLEDQVNKQQVSIGTAGAKLAVLGFMVATTVGALVSVVATRFIH